VKLKSCLENNHNFDNLDDEEAQQPPRGDRTETEPIEDLELIKLANSSRLCSALIRADALDRRLSERVQSVNHLAVEIIMFPFGHFFNRFYNLLGFLLTFVVGTFRYDHMLVATGYQPLGSDITMAAKAKLGLAFMVFYCVTLFLMISTVQIMKVTIKRTRPSRNLKTTRLSNLRAAENGTYSMPSGDAAAAAVFCFLYAVLMQLPETYFILPMVCLGRVYYQCHWFGDTIVGTLIGTLWAMITFACFASFVPILQAIGGPNTFSPINQS
jgi:membrane-associated phospholipid phosphatase